MAIILIKNMVEQGERRLSIVRENGVVPLTILGVSEKTLEAVLKNLRENDDLFDYNVPSHWRDPAKAGLQEFLVRRYSPTEFEITDEDSVKKYLKKYDFVSFNGNRDGFEYSFYLKPGMNGVIKGVDLSKEYPIIALWEKCEEHQKEKELIHNGKNMILIPDPSSKKITKITNYAEILAMAKPGMILEPTAISFAYSYYLPLGTRGIVNEIDNSKIHPVKVIFGNTKGFIPNQSGALNCTYDSLKLLRENRINIRKLISELS